MGDRSLRQNTGVQAQGPMQALSVDTGISLTLPQFPTFDIHIS